MCAALRTEVDRLADQLTLGQYRVGPEAARDIAERVTGEHGFWDFEERKAAHLAQIAQSVKVITVSGEDPHQFLAGLYRPGGESPRLAA
jgi:hypothetical protein